MLSPDPIPPAPPASPPEDFDLATPEEVAARRLKRRLLIGGSVGAVLLGLGVWQAHPVAGAIKGWQARRAAAEALRLLDANQPEPAVGKLQDAMILRGMDPEVERAAAVFLTRIGHGREAIGFWKQVEAGRPLTHDEQRDFAADSLVADDLAGAGQRLRAAWPEGMPGSPADWALGMRIASQAREGATATALARRLADPQAANVSARQRLEAAVTLLAAGDPADRETGERTLRALADDGESAEGLDALVLLLRQSAQAITSVRAQERAVPEATTRELLALAARVDAHPQVQTAQRLAAVEARIAAQPPERARLIQGAVERYRHSEDNNVLAALASWLYAQGEFAKVLEVDTPERATGSRALYLQSLDALGATGQWAKIRQTLEGQRFSLDPMVEQMYLARCAAQLGQPEVAALRWGDALKAAGANPDKLVALGRYAQSNNAPATAEAALGAAAQAAPGDRTVHEARLHLFEGQGRTVEAREELKVMLDASPQDLALRNDYAYLGALLGQDLAADRDTARELVRAEPDSLPHRVTLALTELRLGHGLAALEPLQEVPTAAFRSQPRFLAVDAVVRWETGFSHEARQEAALLTPEVLLPEEWQLVQPIRAAGAQAGPTP